MNYKYHLNNAKFKGVFPFYISDINDKFFVSLNNHPNKHFVQKILPLIYSKLDHQSSLEFQALENLTKEERIRLMLNLALKKIISKTGSKTIPLFQNLNPNQPSNPIYIQQLWESDRYYQDEEAQIERRYNFVININQKSYLTNYLNQIQLSFYLDEENKILSGGFSLNFENNNPNITFHETVRKIYLRSLIHNFIIKQLYPLSLNNILELVPDYPNNSQLGKQRHQKKPYLKFVSNDLDRIKANWNNLIEKKYLRYVSLTEAGKQYYYDDLFFSIMISVMVILLLYQELKIYFTSKTPELILGLLTKNLDPVQEGPSSAKRDFYQLSKYLQTQYFAQKPRINVKKIRDPEELIDAIAKARADYGFESFGYPVPIYEIVIDFQGVIISADSIFHANDHLKSIYLMIILPELFGLDEDTTYFVDYGQLLQIIAADSFTAKWVSLFAQKLEETNTEINHNLATFLNNKSVLIFATKNENHIYYDYYWALIYARSIEWIKNDIEFDFDNDVNPKKHALFYQQKIEILENLIFDWHDDFYGLAQIKPIVYKIDKIANLKSSIRRLIKRISKKNEIYKKDNEIQILVNAFLVAALIGFNNFFGMIYTVLTVDKANLTAANITVITISCVFAAILLTIITTYFWKIFRQKRILKLNQKG